MENEIEELKSLAEVNGITGENLAHEIGVTLQTVGRWFRGTSKPKSVFMRERIKTILRKYRRKND